MNDDSRFNKIRTIFGKFYRLGLISKLYISTLHYYNNLNIQVQF